MDERSLLSGVVLCIIAVIPLIIAALMEAPDYICCEFTSLLLLIIAVGVNMILRVSIVKASYDALLQEGEFSKEEKFLEVMSIEIRKERQIWLQLWI